MFSTIDIYTNVDMVKLIERKEQGKKPQDAPRESIQRIRSVIGVFHYMQEKEVAKIFKDEKVRIGMVIDGIDKSLAKTPRQVTRGNKRTFAPWTPLDLGPKWDAYMDDVFKAAKDKGTKFVEDNIKRLKDEYTSQKAKDGAIDDPKKSDQE